MASKRKLFIAATCPAILAMGLWFYSHSLLRPESAIRTSLLKQTPLGTSYEEVRSFAERQGWRTSGNWNGFLKQEAGKLPETVGVTSIEVNLGCYSLPLLPLRTDVTAFWGFDSEWRLIDVWVWKTTDGP